MQNQQRRLQAAIDRRDAAAATIQKLQGRLASAQERLDALRADCTRRGVDPERIAETIALLERRFETTMADYESQVQLLETSLASYTEG
jgi:exonuclease VII small subunit